MAYKDKTAERLAGRIRQRTFRERKAKARGMPTVVDAEIQDSALALAEWAASKLVVPPGHPLAGQPMVMPDFGIAFIRDALAHRESLLCVARKNAKSATVAVLVLGLLAGPLRRPGLRIGTVSITREKAGELLTQCRQIAEASGLQGLEFLRTPAPGRIRTPDDSLAEFLSADKSSGHASGFDLAILDELGLFTERDRELVAGMRSATSARDGRLIALSIRGDCPMLEEMLERRDLPTTAVHLYAPDGGAAGQVDIMDPEIWAAGNPGLAVGIKSRAYMVDEAARVVATPTDIASFQAFDLNLKQVPGKEMIFAPADLGACYVEELPARTGPAYLGLDFGGATSGTAAFAVWPSTGRCEAWLAFGDTPGLVDRGRVDGARYDLMAARGELVTYPGRVTPVDGFLGDVAGALAGVTVKGLAADGYKDGEVRQFLDRAGLRWPYSFRRVGAGKDGGADVRATQRLVLNQRLKLRESMALTSAVGNSTIRRDANGNPGLDRAKESKRIDLLSAMVIACGLAEAEFDKPKRGVYRGAV